MSDDVRLVGISKRFREVTAVEHLDLAVAHGEFFSLLGPSGCGKTTTLRIIGGFEMPSGGQVYVGGEDMADRPPFRRPVNTVFQSYALFQHMDVYENVAFGLRRSKVPEPEVRSRVAEVLRLVQLEGFERRRPRQLSGGQQQRVALARAIVNRPTVLLLDEPLGALDLKLRKEMQLELKRIQDGLGTTFVYVTHDQEEALTMSDRIAVMHGGRLEQVGTPADIYERPRTRFVADFIGVTNFFSGKILGRDGQRLCFESGDGLRLFLPAVEGAEGRQATLAVRPEKLRMAQSAPEAHVNTCSGTVAEIVYLGPVVQHRVRTASGAVITVLRQNDSGDPPYPVGSPVHLWWEPSATQLLED